MSVLIPFAVMIGYAVLLAFIAMYLDRWRASKPQKPRASQASELIEELIKRHMIRIPERPTVTTSQK